MVLRDTATESGLSRPARGGRWLRAWQSWIPYLAGAFLLALLLYYGPRTAGVNAPVHLVVYAFSTQEEVLTQSIFPAFETAWEAETGRDLTLDGVFGPSAMLAGQINLGAPADVALFSNAHHVTYLRMGKQVRVETQSHVLGSTPMVIVTRPGNPHGLETFADLARPGLRLVHANPRTSGGGEWALLAEYGSARVAGGDPAASAARLSAIWENVSVLAPSARSALTLFELGTGDALVTYEQDALLALERGVPLTIIRPSYTIVAEPVAVIVDRNVTRTEQPVAAAFVRYLLGDAGQQHFAHYYQRPVAGDDPSFSPLRHPFTVADLGGWPHAYREVVELLWQAEIEPSLSLQPFDVRAPAGAPSEP